MAVKTLGTLATPAVWWLLAVLVGVFFLAWLIYRWCVLEEPEPPAQEARPEPGGEDDLKVIEGIGPKLEQVLKEAGIRTYGHLATKSPEELRAILDAAGIARISNPQTWAEQAKLAAEGRWEELAALQESLKGGVRRA